MIATLRSNMQLIQDMGYFPKHLKPIGVNASYQTIPSKAERTGRIQTTKHGSMQLLKMLRKGSHSTFVMSLVRTAKIPSQQ